ncbi:MAG: CHRD domain-containing protein, partial [Halioglobus sp.]
MTIRPSLLKAFVLIGVVLLVSSAAVAQEGKGALFAVLSGGYEVDGETGEANVGDGNGHGSATMLLVGQDTVCYGVTVDRIDGPVAMHVHEGAAGSNGGVVIGLTPPDTGS